MTPLSSLEARSTRQRFLVALGLVVLATAGFAAWLAGRVGGEASVLRVSDTGQFVAALAAAVTCFVMGRRHREVRLFWSLLASACGAWAAGQLYWSVYELGGFGHPPVPSWADLGYLAFIPLAVAALLRHPGMRGTNVRQARSLLDGLSVAVALLFLSWMTVLGPLWHSSDLGTLGGVVTLAYPFGDVVIGFFVVLAMNRMTTPDRLGLWFLLAGLIAIAFADSAYAYFVDVKSYTTGNLLDTGWVAGFCGIALGALASDVRNLHVRAVATAPPLASLVAPLLPMFVALIVAAFTIDLAHRPDGVALGMVSALVLFALVRLALLRPERHRPAPPVARPAPARAQAPAPARPAPSARRVEWNPRTTTAPGPFGAVVARSHAGERLSSIVVMTLIVASAGISLYDLYLLSRLVTH